MSGTGKLVVDTFATGDQRIDGVMHSREWGDATITVSFPSNPSEYTFPYSGFGEQFGLFQASAALQNTVLFILDADFGNTANDGFAVEGFTTINVVPTNATDATVRVGQTTSDPYNYGTAWAYYPFEGDETSGDVWLTSAGGLNYSNPQPGNYAWLTAIHEVGHALGLEHAHENGDFGAVPTRYDAMEFTVTSYRAYVNASLAAGYTNEDWGYPQTYMMLDIAALQHKYGANFSTNSGDTTYSWRPDEGTTFVDGVAAISPGSNRIFATIWDGGGTDTYDLSAYSGPVQINLSPGEASLFSGAQLAGLGEGNFAQGNIYNALQYQGDARSLIENAIGGNGGDRIIGNQADNDLRGGIGRDTLDGATGNDTLFGQQGDDRLLGGTGFDELYGGLGNDNLQGGNGNDSLYGEGGSDQIFAGAGQDLLRGGWFSDWLYGGAGNDRLEGQGGFDRLFGGAGNDILLGGDQDDRLFGAANNDYLGGGKGDDILRGEGGRDILSGETGDDTLEGGWFSDRFVFRNDFGRDVITDFDANNLNERIDLRQVSAITDLTDLYENHLFEVGADVEIRDLLGNVVVVENTTLASLTDGNDFLI